MNKNPSTFSMDQFCSCVTFFIIVASVVDVVVVVCCRHWTATGSLFSKQGLERERKRKKFLLKIFRQKILHWNFFLLLHLLQLQLQLQQQKAVAPIFVHECPFVQYGNCFPLSLSQSFSLTFSAEGVVREEFFHPDLNFHSSSPVKSSSVGIDCHQKWHQTPLSLFALWWLQIFWFGKNWHRSIWIAPVNVCDRGAALILELWLFQIV